ncbi:unnamed protein product [Urochloa humidicola]
MEQRPQQRRRKNTKSPAATTIHDVPDELLRLILLRLDSPLWLLRAACASKRFRRAVITDADDAGRAILRLARSLHPPAVVGGYHNHSGPWRTIAFVPSSPSAPIDDGRFSLDWLPEHLDNITNSTGCRVADCHGGLVLLLRRVFAGSDLAELIVVDPLTRRHREIHRPPDEHTGSNFPDIFLLAGDDNDDDGGDMSVSNFRLLYSMLDKSSDAYVFSTADGGGWRLLRPLVPAAGLGRVTGWVIAGRIDGALYVGLSAGTVMVLDNASLEFSEVDLPIRIIDLDPRRYASTFTVVHSAGDDRHTSPPVVRIVHVHGEELEVFRRVGGSSGMWVLEHSIRRLSKAARGLPSCPPRNKGYRRMEMEVMAGGTGFAIVSVELIAGYQRWSFSVDVDTMELQDVPQKAYHKTDEIFTYTLPWPRFLRACPC